MERILVVEDDPNISEMVGEYEKKTIQLMFMYPINRKKLLMSKVIIVYLFTILNVLIGNLFLLMGMSVIDHFIDIIPGQMNLEYIRQQLPLLGVSIIMSGFLSIVPLYFGMKKKSTVHTVVASVVVVALTTTNSGNSIEGDRFLIRVAVFGIIALISILLTMNKTLNNIECITD